MNNIEKEIKNSLQELAQVVTELKTERDMLRKENEYLKTLVEKLTEKPAPYQPTIPSWPGTNTNKGCSICGLGADGKAYGYVCSRTDCPTRVTCT